MHDLILFPELQRIVPLSRTSIWRLERRGKFPRRLVLGAKRVAWSRDEIHAWIATRAAQREAAQRIVEQHVE